MAAEINIQNSRIGRWIERETEFKSLIFRVTAAPESGARAWARTTSGVLVLLLLVQMVTGILLAFHYVPAATTAYTTVAFIELAVRDGAWIRSMHYHSSVLLPIAAGLHILQMIIRSAYASGRSAWTFGLVLLGLVLAAGATGYALPWDARAINGVNIAASLAGNAPLFGDAARAWLIDGAAISTLTLSRFYGLHVYVIPAIIVTAAILRIFIFAKAPADIDERTAAEWARDQFARNMIVVGIVFAATALFSSFYPAPFGPPVADTATYLPRPGPQFLWLFEMQKYTDGTLAAILATGFPAVIIGGLIAVPLAVKRKLRFRQFAVVALYVVGFGMATALTCAAIYQDASEPRIAEQLAKQERDETAFRAKQFEPQTVSAAVTKRSTTADEVKAEPAAVEVAGGANPNVIPPVYTTSCAKCHGASGEGTKKFPELIGVTTREEDQLTPELVLAIINDPKSVGRSTKMPAYHDKLSEAEKQELVSWIRSLKPETDIGADSTVQTAKVDQEK